MAIKHIYEEIVSKKELEPNDPQEPTYSEFELQLSNGNKIILLGIHRQDFNRIQIGDRVLVDLDNKETLETGMAFIFVFRGIELISQIGLNSEKFIPSSV